MALEQNLFIIIILSISFLGTLAISQLPKSKSSYGASSVNISQTFEQWMAKFGRHYRNGEEKEKRQAIFQTNLEYIEKFNKQENKTYRLGLNQFSDLTSEEFHNYHTGYKRSHIMNSNSPSKSFMYQNLSDDDVPDSLDWRESGAVTSVKNQRDCGACWAFSAVAAVEGIIQIRTGNLNSLSVQQLVDCDRDGENAGCGGGLMVNAFDYMISNGGINAESNYPFTGWDGDCDTSKERDHAATITGYERVPPNERDLLRAVSRQPIAVGMDVHGGELQHYAGGVIDDSDCGFQLTHAVTVVGYGKTEEGVMYWLIKNSWGDDWGENGYFRLPRFNGPPQGACGIALEASYPTA